MCISWRGGWIAGCWNAVKCTPLRNTAPTAKTSLLAPPVLSLPCAVFFVTPVGFVGLQVAAGAAGNVWKASCVHRGVALRGLSNACWPCACVRGCQRFVPYHFYDRCACSYHGHPVAAKQLRGMADLTGLDDALVELVNEVSLFTYMPLPVAPTQQHTGRVRSVRTLPRTHAHSRTPARTCTSTKGARITQRARTQDLTCH